MCQVILSTSQGYKPLDLPIATGDLTCILSYCYLSVLMFQPALSLQFIMHWCALYQQGVRVQSRARNATLLVTLSGAYPNSRVRFSDKHQRHLVKQVWVTSCLLTEVQGFTETPVTYICIIGGLLESPQWLLDGFMAQNFGRWRGPTNH